MLFGSESNGICFIAPVIAAVPVSAGVFADLFLYYLYRLSFRYPEDLFPGYGLFLQLLDWINSSFFLYVIMAAYLLVVWALWRSTPIFDFLKNRL